MLPVRDLGALELHDTILVRIEVNWEKRFCTMEIDGPATPWVDGARLRWTGVSSIIIPIEEPWGPSISINEARGPVDGTYEIEMQSGDLITLVAKECSLELLSRAI